MKIPVTALLSATATVTGPSSTTTLFETKTVPLAHYNPGTTTKTPDVSGVTNFPGPAGRPCGESGVCPRDEQGPVIANVENLDAVASLVIRGGDLDGTAAATGGIQMQDVKWTTLTGRASPPLPTAVEAPVHCETPGYLSVGPYGGGHGPVVHPCDEKERLSSILKTATPAPMPTATKPPVHPVTPAYLDVEAHGGHGPVVLLPPDVERSRISELLKTATLPPQPEATEALGRPVVTAYLDKRDTNGPVVINPSDRERLSEFFKTATLPPPLVATEAPMPPPTMGYLGKRDSKGPFPEIDWLDFAVEGNAEEPVSAVPVERSVVQEHESKEGIWGYDEFGYRLPDACRKPHIGNCR